MQQGTYVDLDTEQQQNASKQQRNICVFGIVMAVVLLCCGCCAMIIAVPIVAVSFANSCANMNSKYVMKSSFAFDTALVRNLTVQTPVSKKQCGIIIFLC